MPGAAGVQATPQRRARDGGEPTPNAKRPLALDGLLGLGQAAGPEMSANDMNSFVYRLYHDVEALKAWGYTVNEATGDHAARLDAVRVKTVMEAITSVQQDLQLTQLDVKGVMKSLEDNDLNLKAILNEVTNEIAGKV